VVEDGAEEGEQGGSKRSSIRKSVIVGKPRIVLTEMSEPSAIHSAVGLESESVYGMW
jgi:hypothetical protein